MNIKVLELIYREDYQGLNALYVSQAIPPDAPINDVTLKLLIF